VSIDARSADGAPRPLLDLGRVVVLAARPRELSVHLAPDQLWPCPACGRRQPLSRSWVLTVRNDGHPPHEREVIACADCVDGSGAVDR
jgi:hypothetical protein